MMIVVYLMGLVVFMYSFEYLRKQITIYRWISRHHLREKEEIFNQLYADVNGFMLSKQCRQVSDAPEYVYGEIEWLSFAALLSLCDINERTIYYDLGSGTGKSVLACAMLYNVQKSCGIELFTELHVAAMHQAMSLQLLPAYELKAGVIVFQQANILECNFVDANIIFINATAFIGELWTQLSRHIAQVQANAVVISTSKTLDSAAFVVERDCWVQMSWGVVRAYVQRRL